MPIIKFFLLPHMKQVRVMWVQQTSKVVGVGNQTVNLPSLVTSETNWILMHIHYTAAIVCVE